MPRSGILDLNGVDQYLSKSAVNLLAADYAIAYASLATWAAASGASAVERVLIADEGIVTTGLPAGIKTAIKVTWNGTSALGASIGSVVTVADVNHFFSSYVLAGSQWSGEDIRIIVNAATGWTADTITDATPSTSSWQRTDTRGVSDSGDLIIGAMVRTPSALPASGDILYFTGVQIEDTAVTSFDQNALASFGDQTFYANQWVYAFNTNPQWSMGRYVGAGTREWLINQSGGSWRATGSVDGTASVSPAMGIITPKQWDCLFLEFDAVGNLMGGRLNNGALSTLALASVFQVAGTTPSFAIGANSDGGNKFIGKIGPSSMGCDAAGRQGSLAEIAEFFYRQGPFMRYHNLSAADKIGLGLTEMWDFEGGKPFVGKHSGI